MVPRYIFAIVIFCFIVFANSASVYAVNINNCTLLDSANYVFNLTADIIDSSNSTCMNITAENITLDCGGHRIDATGVNTTNGIYSNKQNTKIKNCVINGSWYHGIHFDGWATYGLIQNNTIASNDFYGIYLDAFASNNVIFDNTITANNKYGIYVTYRASYNNITGNTITEHSTRDIYINPVLASECDKITLENNTGSGNRSILYYNSSTNLEDQTLSELMLCNASNSNVDNVSIIGSGSMDNNGIYIFHIDNSNLTNIVSSDNEYGIYLYYSLNNTLTNITTNSNNQSGIYFDTGSNNNTASGGTLNENEYGIRASSSNNNQIINNTANDNTKDGISLFSSDSNNIENNTASGNSVYGIHASSSDNNTITGNTMGSNTACGLRLLFSGGNQIYYNTIENNTNFGICLHTEGSTVDTIYNNFFNNTINYKFAGTIYSNNWNTTQQSGARIHSNGTYIGGNYWTNSTGTGYSDTCTDSDNDGFCDTLYNISDGNASVDNIDYLPMSSNASVIMSASLVSPTSDTVINKHETFNFSTNVTCQSNSCGNVYAWLDPLPVAPVANIHNIGISMLITMIVVIICILILVFEPKIPFGKKLIVAIIAIVLISGVSGFTFSLTGLAGGTLISTTPGATPFYTSDNNPQSCGNLTNGQTCNNTWLVNATGDPEATYEFYVIYNSTFPDIFQTQTSSVNVSISQNLSHCGTIASSNYTLVANLEVNGTSCIAISADNLTLDCDGYNITGNGTMYGIDIVNRTGVTISNCNIYNFSHGVQLVNSNQSTLNNVNVTNNTIYGVYLHTSSNNVIQNIDAVDNDLAGIAIYYSDNNQVLDSKCNSSVSGIYLYQTPNNVIANNSASSNIYGILTERSEYNTISNNFYSKNTNVSITFTNGSNHNTLSGETSYDAMVGLLIYESNNNSVTGITVKDTTQHSVLIENSIDSNITNSTIYNSTWSGIYVHTSNATRIVDNNISYSGRNAAVPNDGNNIILYHTNSSVVNNNNITYGGNLSESANSGGIAIVAGWGERIENNTINRNVGHGIWLMEGSERINIIGNIINNSLNSSAFSGSLGNRSGTGIIVSSFNYSAGNNTMVSIYNNTIENNYYGIFIGSMSADGGQNGTNNNNNIDYNTINNNTIGIYFGSMFSQTTYAASTSNTIKRNNFTGPNFAINISDQYSSSNMMYYNTFDSNATVYDKAGNGWNISFVGNYWVQYDTAAEGCIDLNDDSICDDPYPIPDNNYDYMPRTLGEITPPTIMNISVSTSGTTTVTTTLNVITNRNSTCKFDTVDASYSNMSLNMTANVTGTGHSATKSYTSDTNGTYYVRCKDMNQTAMQESETINFTADVVEPQAEDTGGGGGGGVAPRSTEIKNFTIGPTDITIEIKQGASTFKSFKIKNNGTANLTFNVTVSDSIKDYVKLFKPGFVLNAGEETDLKIGVLASDEDKPRAIAGLITIKSGGIEKTINVIIIIKAKVSLFDISVKIPDKFKKVLAGEDILFEVELINIGLADEVDVKVDYMIKDFKNNILKAGYESVAVSKRTPFTKTIKVPKSLRPGRYVLEARVSHKNVTASAADNFEVGVEPVIKIGPSEPYYMLMLIIIVIVVCVVAGIVYRSRKRAFRII